MMSFLDVSMRGPQPANTLVLGTIWMSRVRADVGASSVEVCADFTVSGVFTGSILFCNQFGRALLVAITLIRRR